MYRFHKFARKHRAELATVVAIAASLILGTTASAWQAAERRPPKPRPTPTRLRRRKKLKRPKQHAQEAPSAMRPRRQRDEVKVLNEKLLSSQRELQRQVLWPPT